MKIGIIGSGKVGGALGNGWAEKSLAWVGVAHENPLGPSN
jgi:predicted dinucleotide-binding enzyme